MSVRNCSLLHHFNWPWDAQSSAQHGPPAVMWLSGQYLSECKGGYHLFQNMSTTDLFCHRCISCIYWSSFLGALFCIFSSRIKFRLTGSLIIFINGSLSLMSMLTAWFCFIFATFCI